MPRMTMVYTVKTPKLLKDLMIGERIQFLAVEENGKSVVTKIQRDICE
jgi:Cu/Ag efflux protein CusF